MNRYKISQLAEQDLEDIWVYLAQNTVRSLILKGREELMPDWVRENRC